MAAPLETIPECDLGFVELNREQSSTILYLHGALTSPLETSLITPHLERYHILVPAIHINVKALDPRPPFSIPYVCKQVAALIQHRAKDGHAHIFGFSMGAHLAVNLAISYPEQVSTLIATGITLSSRWPSWKRAVVPSFLWAQAAVPRMLPTQMRAQLLNYFIRPASEKLAAEIWSQVPESSWSICKEIGAQISLPPDEPVPIRVRTLIVAASTAPADPIDDAKWVVAQINKGKGDATTVEIKEGSHPWIVQFPELCANLMKAWIEGTDLPAGVTPIL